MANEYSIEIHNFITSNIASASDNLEKSIKTGEQKEQAYWQGQLDELTWIRKYLKEHVDLKDFIYY
jgi:hypothetical protein